MQAQFTDQHPGVPAHAPGYAPPAHAPSGPPPAPPLPYTPLPKRRGAGPTLLLVILALVIPGVGFGLPAVLGGDGGESEDAATETLTGDGYSYAVPAGWADVTADVVDDAPPKTLIDTVSGATEANGQILTQLVVERVTLDGSASRDQLENAWRHNVGEAVGARARPIEGRAIAGESAAGLRVEYVDRTGEELVILGYLVRRGDEVYSLAYRTEASAERRGSRTFASVLDTWSWAGNPDASAGSSV